MPSWTTVPLWAVGQLLTRTALDIAGTAIGELQTWATGADADLIAAEADIATLETQVQGTPFLLMRNTASVTVSNKVPYNTTVTDTHSGWSGANSHYVIPATGYYFAVTQAMANAAAACGPNIRLNGSTYIGGGAITELNGESGNLVGVIAATASDTVDVFEGGASYTPHSASRNFLCLRYIGP